MGDTFGVIFFIGLVSTAMVAYFFDKHANCLGMPSLIKHLVAIIVVPGIGMGIAYFLLVITGVL